MSEPTPETTVPTSAAPDDEAERHRALAIAANNGTWDWLGKPATERTAADDESMTMSAYAAAYHWRRAARRGPANEARAQWLIAKVWIARRRADLALEPADRCSAVVAGAGLVDFDLAYAHEARARALALADRLDEARRERAAALAVPIGDDEDRALVEADLAAEPWFGLEQ